MTAEDIRLDLLNTLHAVSIISFSGILAETSKGEFLMMAAIDRLEKTGRSESCGISNIAETLNVSSPAVSRTITSLENRGYVTRYIDRLNRRNRCVRLTERGAEIFESEKNRLSDFVGKIAERMGEDRLSELLSLSNDLLRNIEEEINLRKDE